jgi:hypothetical protein
MGVAIPEVLVLKFIKELIPDFIVELMNYRF